MSLALGIPPSPPRRIGVFDSGVGGLTVLAALRQALPGMQFAYLGDTARVPYGTKSADVVRRYALEAAWFLAQEPLAALVIACNSASAVAVEAVAAAHPQVPVYGVIEPGARAAVAATRSGRIGVLATEGTVASGAYPRAIAALRPDAVVLQAACPLFVPLAEEGWTEGQVPSLIAQRYLEPVLAAGVDTLVLGCTHYPLLRDVIARVAGPEVCIVDSAAPLAAEVASRLAARPVAGSASQAVPPPEATGVRYVTTDDPARFIRVGVRFAGEAVERAERVDLEGLVAAAQARFGSDTFLTQAATV